VIEEALRIQLGDQRSSRKSSRSPPVSGG
jgi:hypothetical protein